MIDWLRQLDMAKVPRTFRHVLIAGRALELTVDGSESRVVESVLSRLHFAIIHGLRVEDMADTHILDLFRGKKTKLDLLDGAQRRIGMRKD